MKFERFEDIVGWQKAFELAKFVYTGFSDCKDYGFKSQIQRAAVSIMNNIAEGFERKTNNEFKQFLYVAKGSCGELRSMSHLAKSLKYLSDEDCLILVTKSTEISKILSGLIKTL
ncbi:MAG: four helix bundle protein [Bacteroidetes bacterium]|nr:four helix bundle protein [Bacteroidota bacterium]